MEDNVFKGCSFENRSFTAQKFPFDHSLHSKEFYQSPKELLYKYYPPNIFAIHVLASQTIFYCPYNKLNDPHEISFKLDFEVSREMARKIGKAAIDNGFGGLHMMPESQSSDVGEVDKARQIFSEYFKRVVESEKKELSVFSASEDGESPVMWEHYSAGHTGWVFEFESNNFLREKSGEDKELKIWWGVNYIDSYEYQTLNAECLYLQTKFPNKIYCNKHKDWSYEKELRSVARPSTSNNIEFRTETIKKHKVWQVLQ